MEVNWWINAGFVLDFSANNFLSSLICFHFRGLWSVSVISSCYLMKADVVRKYSTAQTVNVMEGQDFDIALSIALNNDEIETLASNRVDFGHLVHPGKMACSELSCIVF
jgi:hypothetical protein